jgi:hypothetical protein
MSFVGKAIKKVFKVAKKIVKSKWFKIAAIVAACVFTAGISAGGFAVFSTAAEAAGGGLGGFFAGVGATMSAGMASIAGAFGIGAGYVGPASAGVVGTTANTVGVLAAGEGAALSAAAGGTAAAEMGLMAGAGSSIASSAMAGAGVGAGSLVGTGATLGAAGGAAGWNVANAGLGVGANAAGGAGGFLSKIGNLLTDKGMAGTAMRQGIMGSISMAMSSAAARKEDKYRRSAYVWGNSAFGGDGSGITMPTLGPKGTGGSEVFQEQKMVAQAPTTQTNLQASEPKLAQLLTPKESVNQQMAQQQRPLSMEQNTVVGQQPAPQAPNALFTPQNLGVA